MNKEALEVVQKTLNKQYKDKGLIHLGLDPSISKAVDIIPTGSLTLDIATGIMGWPRGRIVELFGQESTGKSSLSLYAIANAQKLGLTAAMVEPEQAFDATYARTLGVDLGELIFCQPDYGEQGLDVVSTLIKSGTVQLIVVDSVAALVPKAELEGRVEDNHVGLQARMMSQSLRMLAGIVNKSGCCLLFTNQLRSKIGGYGNPEVTAGGNALKFYASMRVQLYATNYDKSAQDHKIRAKIIKNKLGVPFQEAEFRFGWGGKGINREGELIDLGVAHELIQLSGSWYQYKDIKVQGWNSLCDTLIANPSMAKELEAEVLSSL